jgi:phosphoglycolate phosphatase
MNRVLSVHGFPLHTAEEYREMVGWGLTELVRRALPKEYATEKKIRQCSADMKRYYAETPVEKTKPFPGIESMLDTLSAMDVKLAILSNKADSIVKQVVEKIFPDRQFDSVRGLRDDVPRKPDPAGAFHAAREMEIEPEQILYIGDSDVDMETAINAGMFPAGVSWGYRSPEMLRRHGAEVIFETPEEIPGNIKGADENG